MSKPTKPQIDDQLPVCESEVGGHCAEPTAEQAVSRRGFMHTLVGASMLALGGSTLTACADGSVEDEIDPEEAALRRPGGAKRPTTFDYVIVGSGPGGGPLAVNLARAGFTVAVLEAGIDPASEEAQQLDPSAQILYEQPVFMAVTAEHPLLSWDFFVKHYEDPAKQRRDSKYVEGKGILYSRGNTVGGSSAHNAMIFAYPHDEDFNAIARETGDATWDSRNMRRYFERVERCEYLSRGTPGHGFDGYIPSSLFDARIFDLYPELRDLAMAGAVAPASAAAGNEQWDINHPAVAQGESGTFNTPMHVATKKRISVREHLLINQAALPNNLFLITGALATKIIVRGRKARGVEYLAGTSLYEANKLYDADHQPGPTRRVLARREVIVAAGAFNTPQLLKLSGIGPKAELHSHGIRSLVDLPGVGENLQDRYEITVMTELNKDLELYTRCRPFQPADPCLDDYANGAAPPSGTAPYYGAYANNALFGTRVEKSSPELPLPDLFMAGFALPFRGYYPGYSQSSIGRSWSWLVLKCHNANTAGTVKLRSKDPRQAPDINFRYFEEGNDESGKDLEAILKGLKLARGYIDHPLAKQHVETEVLPGPDVQTDDELRQYIKDESWGHHASCSAKIGARHDPMAVLDSRFRVRGVQNLRVVDASVFPRLPGFFPVAAVLMISEKASDILLADARYQRAATDYELAQELASAAI